MGWGLHVADFLFGKLSLIIDGANAAVTSIAFENVRDWA